MDFEEVVKECKGCVYANPRIVGGDDTLICSRHPRPENKWDFDKCKHFRKEGDDPGFYDW